MVSLFSTGILSQKNYLILPFVHKKGLDFSRPFVKLMTGIEPVTPSLPRKCSTSEPHQRLYYIGNFFHFLLQLDILANICIKVKHNFFFFAFIVTVTFYFLLFPRTPTAAFLYFPAAAGLFTCSPGIPLLYFESFAMHCLWIWEFFPTVVQFPDSYLHQDTFPTLDFQIC